jgi:hypothetical protein
MRGLTNPQAFDFQPHSIEVPRQVHPQDGYFFTTHVHPQGTLAIKILHFYRREELNVFSTVPVLARDERDEEGVEAGT